MHGASTDRLPELAAADAPASEVQLLQAISEVADEAPTVEDALRAALSRICGHTGWQAGRLHFSEDAGDLSSRTFWHLEDPERLPSYRALAQARRDSPEAGLAMQVLAQGSPLWTALPEAAGNGHESSGARATFAFPVFLGKRIFAVLEFFSDRGSSPPPGLVDVIALVCAELGRILRRKPADDELRRSEREYRTLFENAHDAILVVDPHEQAVLDANHHACQLYGYPRAELLGMALDNLWREPEAGRARLREAEQGVGGVYQSRHARKDGSEIVVDVTAGPVEYRGRRALWSSIRDATDRIRVVDALRTSEERYRMLFDASPQAMWVFDSETLRFLAVNDAVTGLPNRALFMERLGMALERSKGRGRGGFAVLFLDLDRFKVVNDSLGHRAGDQLLIQISRRLERTRRAGDTVARLGGDEFAVLVEGVENASDAARVAERVQRELSMPFDIDGQEVFTSTSIGIALGGAPNSVRPEDMLRDADTAMYRAKGMGIAKHAVFDVTMHDRAVAVLQLENDLRRAIERGELRVQYQPIVALGSGRIVGFEALARWQHRQRGTVAPSEFIPLAEETGVIGSLGRWVMQEACTQMRRLQANFPRAPALTLAVNISGRQVLQPDLVEQIDDTLRATGLDARSLRLEITESVLVENAAAATRCLTRLRQLGLQLCIDDFGTGYSSLSYLHRLPIDLLKIDSSFVRTMGSDEKNRRIVETILLLGRNLGVEVVAEGVETTAQATALHRLGCGFVQGFLFSHPVDIDAASALVAGDASPLRAPALPTA